MERAPDVPVDVAEIVPAVDETSNVRAEVESSRWDVARDDVAVEIDVHARARTREVRSVRGVVQATARDASRRGRRSRLDEPLEFETVQFGRERRPRVVRVSERLHRVLVESRRESTEETLGERAEVERSARHRDGVGGDEIQTLLRQSIHAQKIARHEHGDAVFHRQFRRDGGCVIDGECVIAGTVPSRARLDVLEEPLEDVGVATHGHLRDVVASRTSRGAEVRSEVSHLAEQQLEVAAEVAALELGLVEDVDGDGSRGKFRARFRGGRRGGRGRRLDAHDRPGLPSEAKLERAVGVGGGGTRVRSGGGSAARRRAGRRCDVRAARLGRRGAGARSGETLRGGRGGRGGTGRATSVRAMQERG